MAQMVCKGNFEHDTCLVNRNLTVSREITTVSRC